MSQTRIICACGFTQIHCQCGERPPSTWEKETGIQIMDADGWRSAHRELKPKPYDEPITRKEFMARAAWSTIFGTGVVV
jgi:hypothetical protein